MFHIFLNDIFHVFKMCKDFAVSSFFFGLHFSIRFADLFDSKQQRELKIWLFTDLFSVTTPFILNVVVFRRGYADVQALTISHWYIIINSSHVCQFQPVLSSLTEHLLHIAIFG